jgi:hypothetical protein
MASIIAAQGPNKFLDMFEGGRLAIAAAASSIGTVKKSN